MQAGDAYKYTNNVIVTVIIGVFCQKGESNCDKTMNLTKIAIIDK